MIYFTADTHFFHKNEETGDGIIKYESRPFETIEEMNKALINKWNTVVSNKDDVYHLGDFAFCTGKGQQEQLDELLNSLNGRIYLIKGNHDRKPITSHKRFAWVKDYYELKDNHQKYILFHYPIESWNAERHGRLHLHGHTHGKIKKMPFRLDVGVDVHNYFPISLEEVKQMTSVS